MFSALRWIVLERGPLWWLGGPVLDKELKVLARRRRTYAVRFGYVVFLMVLVLPAWLRFVVNPGRSAQLYSTARLPQLGRSLVITLVWFQFYAAQVIALVTFSGTISTEIRRRTLDVLLSTPINSVQIVLGKLVGGLLPVIFLIGVSLPFLAVIRVFGGIEWDYVVAAVCITLTATLFVAAVSMLVSVRIHQPYKVILLVLAPLLTIYGTSQITLFVPSKVLATIVTLLSPACRLFLETYRNTALAARMPANGVAWQVHCLFILGVSVAAVLASMVLIRRGAYAAVAAPKKRKKATGGKPRTGTGSPVLWKDLGSPFQTLLRKNIVIFVFLIIPLIGLYGVSASGKGGYYLSIYTMGIWIVALVRTAVMAATAITREKEARTWSTLLCTTLGDRQIIRDKAAAVLWRNWPAWMVLTVNAVILLLRLMLKRQGMSALDMGLSFADRLGWVAATVSLLVGGGLFFSVRLKSSTAAVVATLTLVACLWVMPTCLIPVFYRVVSGFLSGRLMLFFHQLAQLVLLRGLFFVVGLLLFRMARLRLRRHIF